MEYRRLGRSGLQVSVLGLGTNAFGGPRATPDASKAVLDTALEEGITLIDTADNYAGGASETVIGEWLRGKSRDAVVLATKAGLPAGPGPMDRGSSRSHLMHQLEQSLKRLGTDYVDLYQIHTFDPDTPLEETLATLDAMVRSGKVRYVGASNYRAWELMKALGISDRYGLVRYVGVQPSYSLGDRVPEEELVPLCADQGVGLIAYFPLAGGLLTGKYRPDAPPPPGSRASVQPAFGERMLGDRERLALSEGLRDVAGELGATPSQVALSWLFGRPTVASAIAGATRPEQIRENVGALSVSWTPEALERLESLSAPFRSDRFGESRLA